MKNSSLWQIIKFTLCSASAAVIQIASFEILFDACHITYTISYVISLVLSVLWNFTFNRKFTFQSANNVPLAMLLVFLYYVVFTPLSTWWGDAMESAGVAGILVTIFSMLVNFVTEFLYQRFVVFRGSIGSAVNKEEENFKLIIKITRKKL